MAIRITRVSLTVICLVQGIFFTLLACNKKSEIDGIWIGANTIYGDSLIEPNSVRPIVAVKDGKLSYRTIGYIDGVYNQADSATTSYVYKNNRLYLNKSGKEIGVDFLTRDSLIAYYPDRPNIKMAFNRINGNNIDEQAALFKNKEFKYIGNNDTENSIYFVNDSVEVEYNRTYDKIEIRKWELIEFEKQFFLTFNDPVGSISLHIDSISRGNIYLSEYSGAKSYSFTWKQSFASMNRSLLGNWKLDSIIDTTSTWSNFYKIEKIESINFGKNHLSYKKNEENIRKKFVLSGFGNLLIFTDQHISNSSIWKISLINNTIELLI